MVNSVFGSAEVNSVFKTSVVNSAFNSSQGDVLENAIDSLYDNVGETFIALTTNYSEGYINDVRDYLNFQKYTELSSFIYANNEVSESYTKFIDIISKSLEGLYKTTIRDVETEFQIQQLESTITQLKNFKQNTSALRQISELPTVGTLRPEIKLYIERHGFPSNYVFDPEKLSIIKSELEL